MHSDCAYLANDDRYVIFRHGKRRIRFKAPYSLERFTAIKEWDHGYLVVMAQYAHNAYSEEEYIDLTPILQDLYINPDEFLQPIKEVQLDYAGTN